MASKAVVDAVEARLAANWANCPIKGLNTEGEAPSDATAFLEVQYPLANEHHVGIAKVGDRTFREDGAFRLVLSMQRGTGVALGLTWAEQLCTLFRAQQFSGVSCYALSLPFLDDSNDNGNYFLISIVIQYYFDLRA